jgi:hypothetical protein
MQELGVWTTAEGSTAARLQLESDEGMPGWASGALQGAAGGAATGAIAGPYGALIGAVAGAGIGAYTGATAPPAGSGAPSATGASTATGAAPTPKSPTSSGAQAPRDSASRATVIQALQQFAAVVPTLVQLLAGSGGGKELSSADNGDRESYQEADWGPESFRGSWTLP